MTQEDKKLLLIDLCTRLSYKVKGRVYAECTNGEYDVNGNMIFFDSPFDVILDDINISTEELHVIAISDENTIAFIEDQQTYGSPYTVDEFKQYLRPMTSLSEKEKKELGRISCEGNIEHKYGIFYRSQDYLNSIHVDYRGLIEKRLALEAPEGMY